jgi:hypothetical protein
MTHPHAAVPDGEPLCDEAFVRLGTAAYLLDRGRPSCAAAQLVVLPPDVLLRLADLAHRACLLAENVATDPLGMLVP